MNAVMIQDTGAEIVSENTDCISAGPLGAFTIVISDTQVLIDVKGMQWKLPIANLILFIQTQGTQIQ